MQPHPCSALVGGEALWTSRGGNQDRGQDKVATDAWGGRYRRRMRCATTAATASAAEARTTRPWAHTTRLRAMTTRPKSNLKACHQDQGRTDSSDHHYRPTWTLEKSLRPASATANVAAVMPDGRQGGKRGQGPPSSCTHGNQYGHREQNVPLGGPRLDHRLAMMRDLSNRPVLQGIDQAGRADHHRAHRPLRHWHGRYARVAWKYKVVPCVNDGGTALRPTPIGSRRQTKHRTCVDVGHGEVPSCN